MDKILVAEQLELELNIFALLKSVLYLCASTEAQRSSLELTLELPTDQFLPCRTISEHPVKGELVAPTKAQIKCPPPLTQQQLEQTPAALPVPGFRGVVILKKRFLWCGNFESRPTDFFSLYILETFLLAIVQRDTFQHGGLFRLEFWAESNMRHVISMQGWGFWLSEGKSGKICGLLSDSISLPRHKSAVFVAIQSN